MARISGETAFTSAMAILLAVLVLPLFCTSTIAQPNTVFTPADKFSIPEYNATISFSVNGTYAKATLENGIWNFADLRLNNSKPLDSFNASARDSNVTVFSYQTSNATFWSARLRYAAGGQGRQSFNLGLDSDEIEWGVVVNGTFKAEGDGWSKSPDATLTITGATGNVTIVCYAFLGALERSGSSSNLPFYQRHSVAILTTAATGVIIAVAIAIRVINKEKLDKDKAENGNRLSNEGLRSEKYSE